MASYNSDQLAEAVRTSTSYRQTLIKLGLSEKGGNNATLKRKILEFGVDASHFTGKAHSKGKKLSFKTDTEKYLSNEMPIGSFRLKNRLIQEGYFKYECSNCSGTEWLGQPIPLELDHIDGNNADNQFHNLRLLCPNCHALTPTYRGKNQERAKNNGATRGT